MTDQIRFFDGHNDFLLRLMFSPVSRDDIWHGSTRDGHLDLPRMKAGGFAGGLFAIFVPPIDDGSPPDFMKLMASPPYDLPMPPGMSHEVAQRVALRMAGQLHWMARSAPGDFTLCRTASETRTAMQNGKIAGVMHMEGAEAIGPVVPRRPLPVPRHGLRSLGPVWSAEQIWTWRTDEVSGGPGHRARID